MDNLEVITNSLEDRRPKNWFWDYNDVFDSDLSAHAKLVRMYLARCAGEERKAWPSINTIAKHCGISKPTVKRAISELEEKGWLIKTSRVVASGEHLSNVYVLTHPDVANVASVENELEQGGGFSQNLPVKNITTGDEGGRFSQNPPGKNITTFEGGVGSHRTYVGSQVAPNNTNLKINNINNNIQHQQQDLNSLEDTRNRDENVVDVVVGNKGSKNLQKENGTTPGRELTDVLIEYALGRGIELTQDFSELFLGIAGDLDRAKSAIDIAARYASRPGVEIENPEGLLINSLKLSSGVKFLETFRKQGKTRNFASGEEDEKYRDLYLNRLDPDDDYDDFGESVKSTL